MGAEEFKEFCQNELPTIAQDLRKRFFAELTVEQRMEGVPLEQRLEGMEDEQVEAYLAQKKKRKKTSPKKTARKK